MRLRRAGYLHISAGRVVLVVGHLLHRHPLPSEDAVITAREPLREENWPLVLSDFCRWGLAVEGIVEHGLVDAAWELGNLEVVLWLILVRVVRQVQVAISGVVGGKGPSDVDDSACDKFFRGYRRAMLMAAEGVGRVLVVGVKHWALEIVNRLVKPVRAHVLAVVVLGQPLR